jgi:peroxiredoxin
LQLSLLEVESTGVELVAISPQLPDPTKLTAEKNAFNFHVLSDVGNRVGRKFGLVFALPERLRPLYKEKGIDLPALHGDDKFELPLPAIYVIAKDGTIQYVFVDPDYTIRGEPEEVIQALKKMKK